MIPTCWSNCGATAVPLRHRRLLMPIPCWPPLLFIKTNEFIGTGITRCSKPFQQVEMSTPRVIENWITSLIWHRNCSVQPAAVMMMTFLWVIRIYLRRRRCLPMLKDFFPCNLSRGFIFFLFLSPIDKSKNENDWLRLTSITRNKMFLLEYQSAFAC